MSERDLQELTRAIKKELEKEGLGHACCEAVVFHGEAKAVEYRVNWPSLTSEESAKVGKIIGEKTVEFLESRGIT